MTESFPILIPIKLAPCYFVLFSLIDEETWKVFRAVYQFYFLSDAIFSWLLCISSFNVINHYQTAAGCNQTILQWVIHKGANCSRTKHHHDYIYISDMQGYHTNIT